MIEKDHPHYNTITFLHFFYKLFLEAKKFFFYAKGSANFDSMKIRFEAYNPLMKSSVISISQEKSFYLEHIRRQVGKGMPAGRVSGGIVCHEGTSYLRVNYDETVAEKIRRNLLDTVSEVISLGFKAEYLAVKLRLKQGDLLTETLINTMSIFDSGTDKRIVLKSLEKLSDIDMDGLFMFRLEELKNRWNEIAEITGKGSLVAADAEVRGEFLRYLVSSIPSLIDKVTVDFTLAGYTLYDEEGAHIEKMRLFSPSASEDSELMYNLICLAPRKVIITGDSVLLCDEAKCLIKELFLTEER